YRHGTAEAFVAIRLSQQLHSIGIGAAQVGQGVKHVGQLEAALPPLGASLDRKATDRAPLITVAGRDREFRTSHERERRFEVWFFTEQHDFSSLTCGHVN